MATSAEVSGVNEKTLWRWLYQATARWSVQCHSPAHAALVTGWEAQNLGRR